MKLPLLLLLSSVLAGCGGDKPASSSPTQVAARVNGDEISSHQVAALLQRQPALALAQPEAASRRALDSLIEQELAAQAARKDGLDKQPRTIQAMELARREVLARAWQDELAAKATPPVSDDVDRYYDANPALFAQRHLYTLNETLVEVPRDRHDAVRALVASAKSVDQMNTALSAQSMTHRSRQFVQAAEDVPPSVLQALAPLQPGQSIVLTDGEALRVFTLLHAQSAPVARRVAAPAIEAYLLNERRRAAVQQGMKALREAGRIEIVAAAASAPK